MLETILAAALAALAPLSADTHPFSIEDMLAMERVSDLQMSPDGKWLAFTVRTTDVEANKGRTDVWVLSIDESVKSGGKAAPRRLTQHEAADSSPRWMPDGKSLVFLSTRSKSSQVWQIAIDGGEARQLTELPLDVGNVLVFPDGGRLLLTMDVYPDAATLADTKARDDEAAKSKVQARVYDELLFRHWDTWEDGKRSHAFVHEIGSSAEPRDLIRGIDADAPTKPFGGSEELAISPDGKEVVFAMRSDGAKAAWTTNVDLYAVPSDGSAAPRCLTDANDAQDTSPVFSPDGSRLAYLAMARPGYEADRQRIVLLDWRAQTTRVLTEDWDRSPAEFQWTIDGKELVATADDVGNHALFAIDATSGVARVLVGKGYNSGAATASHGSGLVAYLHDDLGGPAEIELFGAGPQPLRISHFNDERVAAARTGAYEQFSFAGAGGDTVHGYLVKPVDFDPAKKYPVAFLIHGGPQGSFGDHFHYRWNPQAYAGAGYAAVMVDFHGSTGYGQAFCDAIREDWGGKPYEDLMKGLDHALATYAFLDGARVAALGASYGGYMINWIAGQTDRFKCLVNHDGNLDERLAYFDTEELWFPEWDHGGTPWENPEGYSKHNPIEHVAKWKTPMLVIHGALDYRVVDTQGMSTFTALQRRGIPSKLLYFPDENHWVLKPQNSRLWHQTVLGWLGEWTK